MNKSRPRFNGGYTIIDGVRIDTFVLMNNDFTGTVYRKDTEEELGTIDLREALDQLPKEKVEKLMNKLIQDRN